MIATGPPLVAHLIDTGSLSATLVSTDVAVAVLILDTSAGVIMGIQVGQIGLPIQRAIVDQDGDPVDLTNATTLELILGDRNGNKAAYEATVVGAPTAGVIEYVTVSASDIGSRGRWGIQAHVITPTEEYTTAVGYFTVDPNLV